MNGGNELVTKQHCLNPSSRTASNPLIITSKTNFNWLQCITLYVNTKCLRQGPLLVIILGCVI
jgi:hypothetical protein